MTNNNDEVFINLVQINAMFMWHRDLTVILVISTHNLHEDLVNCLH